MEGLPEIADPPIETAKGFLHEWFYIYIYILYFKLY